MAKLGAVRGMKDLFGREAELQEAVRRLTKTACERYGFIPVWTHCHVGRLHLGIQVATPLLEPVDVFGRTLGDDTDVVRRDPTTRRPIT